MKNVKVVPKSKLVRYPAIYSGIDEDGQPILVREARVVEVSDVFEEKLKADVKAKKASSKIEFLGDAYEGTDENGVRVILTEKEAEVALSNESKNQEPEKEATATKETVQEPKK